MSECPKKSDASIAHFGSSGRSRNEVALEILHRRVARRRFEHFVSYTFPQYEWSRHHRVMCEYLDWWVNTPSARLVIVAPPRHGKALALDTPLPTPTGWTTMGEVRIGDSLLDDHGMSCKVVAATEVMRGRPCYRLAFSDGSQIVADAEHEWLVSPLRYPADVDLLTTRDISRAMDQRYFVRRHNAQEIRIVGVDGADSVPVRCVQVDSLSRMYLASRSMIPTHNSELVSRRLPAWILGREPDANIIACSYGADLASRMNRDVQRIIDSEEYRSVFPDTQLFGKNIRTLAAGTWMRNSDLFEVVGHRGSYRSAGVGGGITGMGFDYGIIDDPIKSAAEAISPVMRQAVWEWFTSTFYTRQHKGAKILLTLTRWHHDDLAGRLLADVDPEESDIPRDNWRVLHLPALMTEKAITSQRQAAEAASPLRSQLDAISAEMDSLAACADRAKLLRQEVARESLSANLRHTELERVESEFLTRGEIIQADELAGYVRSITDPREVGEALWESRFGKDFLHKTETTLGPYTFGSLYGGDPTPRQGGLFTIDGLSHYLDALPVDIQTRFRVWDKGYAAKGDWTVGVLMGRTASGLFVIEDVVRFREHPETRNRLIKDTAIRDNAKYPMKLFTRVEQPPGAGSETTMLLMKELAGFAVRAFRPQGDKSERAEPFAAQCQAGNVRMMRANWNRAFVEELTQFPGGAHDDCVDAASAAFLFLTNSRQLVLVA